MIVRSKIPVTLLIREIWKFTLAIVIYTATVSALDLRFHLEELHFPVGVVTVLGTTLGILLAFRTNAAYGRWWEARIIWGRIVNDSRTWTRELLTFASTGEKQADKDLVPIAHRQFHWCYALARSLRRQDPLQDLETLMDQNEWAAYREQKNVPNAILARQGLELRRLRDEERIDPYQFVALESTLTRLTDSMGGCERINNTPFPRSYGLWINMLIYLFVVLLPFALVDMPAVGLMIITTPIAVGFLVIDKVADYLEDPFIERASSTAMLHLSRTIEINIRQMLNDENLPAEMKPVNGVLL